jgi:hypothetical protein
MTITEIHWRGSSFVLPTVVTGGVTWAREHGYPVYIWTDTNASG